MGKLEGYTCDTCGKHGKDTSLGLTPYSWYKVYPGFDNWKDFSFCSKDCLTAWVTGNAPVAVPEPSESRGVLFRKLLKAVFS